MKNSTKIALTTAATAGLAFGIAAPAMATEEVPEPYVIAAWKINTPGFASGGDVWGGGGQTIAHHIETSGTDLTEIQSQLACGTWYQIDEYNNDPITAALIAVGLLQGPNNPQESPATGVDPWYIASWYSGDCAPEPEDMPYTASGSDFTCDFTTNWSKEGYYAKSFDAVDNVWSFATEPTITAESSETVASSEEDRVANDCAGLPVTGFADWMPFVGVGAIFGILLGGYARFRRA